jgi:hypothetical protein
VPLTVAVILAGVAPSAMAAPKHHHDASPGYGVTWTVDSGANALTEYAADASGAASPVATLSGAVTGLDDPSGVAVGPKGAIWVANAGNDSITEYSAGSTGDATPVVTISGSATGLDGPRSITLADGDVWVTDPASNLVEAFSPGESGDVLPAVTIAGPKTELDHPIAVAVSDEIPFVTVLNAPTSGTASVTSYLTESYGNIAPVGQVTGVTGHPFVSPTAMASAGFGEVWVADGGAHSVTALFSIFGNGPSPAIARLAGASTDLDNPSGLSIDALGRLAVSDGTAHTVSLFAAGAHGDVAPIRTITGVGSETGSPDALAVTGAAPGAPTAVKAVAHDGQARIHWTAPTSTGGGVVGYDVIKLRKARGSTSGGFIIGGGDGLTVPVETTTTSIVKKHLVDGRTYFFEVFAVNEFGMSKAGRSNTVTPLTVPSAPGHVLAIGGDQSLAVGWTKPAHDGGEPISHYRVEYATCSPAALGCSFKSEQVAPSRRRARVSGLAAGTKYHVRVIAESPVGAGRPSKVATATTT